MRFLFKLLLTAIFIMVLANYFNVVYVRDTPTAVIVALVLAFLNSIVKPILVILTLPVTIFTLGLFLLFINAGMIMLASEIVGPGFRVNGWWAALWVSLALSVFQYIIEKLTEKKKP
jgi:putative membrane protein